MKIDQFVLATLNNNKVQEINPLCKKYKVTVRGAREFTNELPEEDGDSFEANATIKAEHVAKVSNLPSLADDSGLCVEALDGAPGIYSARWAGENNDYDSAINKIYTLMANTSNFNAKFVCVLALCMPNAKEVLHFRGEIEGTIVRPPRGDNGFAYNPIFMPKGYSKTFAEMDAEQRNAISHRSIAFNLFAKSCLLPN